MNGGEIFFTIIINCLVIYFLHILHKLSIAKTVKRLRKEVDELENLVAAIIEEFEEVADRVLKVEGDQQISKPDKLPVVLEEAKELAEKAVQPAQIKRAAPEQKEPIIETLPIFELQEEISDSKHQRIFQLWQQGLAVEEIAKQLGTGRGEVQLILGIHRRS